MTKLDGEARKQMQLQLGAQSAEAWMLDAAVVAWRLRTALDENLERNVTNYQLRVANTQCQGLVVAAANLSMPSMLSYINSTLDSLSHGWPRSLAQH